MDLLLRCVLCSVFSPMYQPACCTLVPECTSSVRVVHTHIVTSIDLLYNDWMNDLNRGISRTVFSISSIPVAAPSKAWV